MCKFIIAQRGENVKKEKTVEEYYCDFCGNECTDKHHKLTIPKVEYLGANSPDQSMIESIDVDVCHRCAEMTAVTLDMLSTYTQDSEKYNGSITRDVTEYETLPIIKRIKFTIDCDYSKKKQEE